MHGYRSDDPLRRAEPIDRDRLVTSWSDSEAKQALFQEITSMPVQAPERTTPTRRSRPRRAVVLAASIGVMALATAAGALTLLTPSDSTAVACHDAGGGVDVIQAATGDPVLDCQAQWERRTDQPAPDMVAYDNGQGGIEVLPASAETPNGWQALDGGVQQAPELIELETALDDVIAGLRADCYPLAEAEPIVRRELDRLGLSGWTVTSDRGAADGTATCSYFSLSVPDQQVTLIPMTGTAVPSDDPVATFAHRLGDTLDDQCLTVTEVGPLAVELAGEAGLTPPQLDIREIHDPAADCTRAHIGVGGVYTVTLRGPMP